MKILVACLFFVSIVWGGVIHPPKKQYKVDGGVTDIVYKDAKLYCATVAGVVDIIDTQKDAIIQKITLDKIKDFMGDPIDAKIYSVDVLKQKVLILSQAQSGYREVRIFENGTMKVVIPASKKLYIAKAKFLDENTLVLGLLSNDIISYNLKTASNNWIKQASMSKFSNFALSEDKAEVVIADESGDLHIFDTRDGTLLKVLSGKNLDNVFQVDYKNKIIATAGQDRRVVVYNLKFNSAYYKTANFLIYSVGVSPSGALVGYASDENNNVTVFKTNTKSTVGVFGGNSMTLTNILFINEKEFFVSSDDKIINFYTID